jgi:hypothetical protein
MELEWLENVWCLFRHKRLIELDELSGRTTGRLGHTWPTTAYAIRGTAKAGPTILYHLRNCRRPHSSSVMTAGRRSCWSMGTAAASAGAAGPSEGLRAGRSSGQTKPEYTAASGRRDHATFGSWLMRHSDDLDSEPDYLLLPTRHGPGGTLLDYSAFPLNAQITVQAVGI